MSPGVLSLIALAEFAGLYLSSQRLTKMLFGLIFLLTRSRMLAMVFITSVLFPGTVVHELSHLFTAEILGVRTGKLSLTPESLEEEETIYAGTVMIGHSDPFRRAAIGIAPMIVGITVLTGLSWWLSQLTGGLLIGQGAFSLSGTSPWLILLVLYLIFAVANSMFSSKEDMKGVPPVIIVLLLLIAAAYFAGFRISLTGKLLQTVVVVLSTLVSSLGFVLALTVAGIILISVAFLAVEQVTGRRIIWK